MWPLLEGEVVAMPRPYPPEFRQQALDPVRSGRPGIRDAAGPWRGGGGDPRADGRQAQCPQREVV